MQPAVNAFQNGAIEIFDPDIEGGVFNVWDNEVTGREQTIFWAGPARIQPMRWPTMVTGKAEQSAYRSVRFQIPLTADIGTRFLREGMRVRVTDGGMLPDLMAMLYVVTAATNSSFAWNRTIETVADTGIELL